MYELQNKVFYLRNLRINLFKSNMNKLNHFNYGICVESGNGRSYKSFWFNIGKYKPMIKTFPNFIHVQGALFAISLSY